MVDFESISMIYGILFVVVTVATLIYVLFESSIKEKKTKKEQQLRIDAVAQGKWDVPYLQFYTLCSQENISDFTSSVSMRKAKLILEDLLRTHNLSPTFATLYCTKEKLDDFFEQGKQLYTAAKNSAEKEEIEKKKREEHAEKSRLNTPICAELNEDQKRHQDIIDALMRYSGVNKRKNYIRFVLNHLNDKINNDEKFCSLLDDLSDPLMYVANLQTHVNVDKVGNTAWSYGGAGAEQMARFHAEQANQVIDARNEQVMLSARQQASQVTSLTRQARDRLSSLKQQYKKLSQICSEKKYQYKLDFDTASTKDLYPLLSVSGKVGREERTLKITASVSSQDSNLFASIHDAVIDGMLTANIYCRGILVDKVNMALPMDGISHNDSAQTIFSYARKKLPSENEKYTVKFEPIKLWIMER